MTSVEQGPETFLRILADLGSVTSDGLQSGTGAKRLELTPLQLVRLAQTLDDAAAIQALGLALHYGEVRTDPFRVEILGWGREWLQAHGMAPSPARRAAKTLTDLKMIEVVPRPGARGAEGKKLAVVSGSKFGLADMDLPAIQWRPSAGQPVTNRPGEDVNALVGAVGEDVTNCGSGPVDNSRPAVGQDPANCESTDGRLVTGQPTVGVNALVSAVGEAATNRSSTPPTRRSEKEEDLLLPGPGAGGALARADLHHFLRDRRVRAALRQRQDVARLALADVFAVSRERAAQALAFFDYPAVTGSPALDLAAFATDLLALDGADLIENTGALATLLKAKGTHFAKPVPVGEQLVTSVVLALGLAMDSDVRSWQGFLVHHSKQTEWHQSTGLAALLSAVRRVVIEPVRPAARAATPPAPAKSVAEGPSEPVVEPLTAPAAGADPDPSAPTPRSSGDHWAFLRAAVSAVAPEWDDAIAFETLKRNFREQANVLERYDAHLAAQRA